MALRHRLEGFGGTLPAMPLAAFFLASQLRTARTGEAPRVARTANPLMAMLRLAATPEGH